MKKLIGQGRHRRVYDLGDGWVLKRPLDTEWGPASNWREAYCYQQDTSGHLAACYLLDNGDLIMEKVKPVTSWEGLPDWALYIDCCQVGYRKDGALVAFDYGY